MPTLPGYDELVRAATAAPVRGWDFAWLAGRAQGSEPAWSYPGLARGVLARCRRVLDVDTGGGELLASRAPLPAQTVGTEGWPPNIPVARARLEPLGVTVVPAPDPALPVADAAFDLVLNRHGRLDAAETARVLRPGGTLVTQQVGSDDRGELNEALGAAPAYPPGSWTLAVVGAALTSAGLRLVDVREQWPTFTFHDIGAVVYQLRVVSWQIPDFTVERYADALRRLDSRIRATGRFDVHAHRFLIIAER